MKLRGYKINGIIKLCSISHSNGYAQNHFCHFFRSSFINIYLIMPSPGFSLVNALRFSFFYSIFIISHICHYFHTRVWGFPHRPYGKVPEPRALEPAPGLLHGGGVEGDATSGAPLYLHPRSDQTNLPWTSY